MLGGFWNSFKSGARSADDWVKGEARKRQMAAMQAGIDRNRDYVMTQDPTKVADRLMSELGKDMTWRDQMVKNLQKQAGRQQAVTDYVDVMSRGPFQGRGGFGLQMGGPLGKRGFQELLNAGIATDRFGAVVRRGALPTAIGGGAVAAGAGITAGAQQLMALMEFMNTGEQQQARVEQSPLA